jgi:hypothetical protein
MNVPDREMAEFRKEARADIDIVGIDQFCKLALAREPGSRVMLTGWAHDFQKFE